MRAHEPAFPINECSDDGAHFMTRFGLTKRELFAALALQGMLQSMADSMAQPWALADEAVQCADALIAALNEEPQS